MLKPIMFRQKHLYTHTTELSMCFLKKHFQKLTRAKKNPKLNEVFRNISTKKLKK